MIYYLFSRYNFISSYSKMLTLDNMQLKYIQQFTVFNFITYYNIIIF